MIKIIPHASNCITIELENGDQYEIITDRNHLDIQAGKGEMWVFPEYRNLWHCVPGGQGATDRHSHDSKGDIKTSGLVSNTVGWMRRPPV